MFFEVIKITKDNYNKNNDNSILKVIKSEGIGNLIILKAKFYKQGKDITKYFDASNFKWYRILETSKTDKDIENDMWNKDPRLFGVKELALTPKDIPEGTKVGFDFREIGE